MQFVYINLYTYPEYMLLINKDDLVEKKLTEKSVDAYWTYNLIVISVLMGVGLLVTFVVPFFGRSLFLASRWHNVPFFLGAQGAVLIYVVLIVVYAILMNRLDRRQRQARRADCRAKPMSVRHTENSN